MEKVKSGWRKKSEIPAISPRATRGTFVPFFFLHWFGVETCIRGNQGLRHFFFSSSATRIQKDFYEIKKGRKGKKETTAPDNPDKAMESFCWTPALGIHF